MRNEEIHHPEAEGVGELRFLAQSPGMGWALSKVLTSSLALVPGRSRERIIPASRKEGAEWTLERVQRH